MQVRAIIEAACEVKSEGVDVKPEIMVPLVGSAREMQVSPGDGGARRRRGDGRAGVELDYMVGTMIELPQGVRGGGPDSRERRVLLASGPTT